MYDSGLTVFDGAEQGEQFVYLHVFDVEIASLRAGERLEVFGSLDQPAQNGVRVGLENAGDSANIAVVDSAAIGHSIWGQQWLVVSTWRRCPRVNVSQGGGHTDPLRGRRHTLLTELAFGPARMASRRHALILPKLHRILTRWL